MLAAIENQLPVLARLLDAGVDREAKDVNGETALMWAAFGGKDAAVACLLEAKVETGFQDKARGLIRADVGAAVLERA